MAALTEQDKREQERQEAVRHQHAAFFDLPLTLTDAEHRAREPYPHGNE